MKRNRVLVVDDALIIRMRIKEIAEATVLGEKRAPFRGRKRIEDVVECLAAGNLVLFRMREH